MHSPINLFIRTIAAAIGIILMIDVLGFVYNINQSNNYETQVTKYIQTAGGVTPQVLEKADKLSQRNYHGYFKLEPHGAGPLTRFQGKYYQGAYPIEWSTDHDNTPIYPNLTNHHDGNFRNITEKGCLMSLLDHPNKLFVAQPEDFANYHTDDSIPDDIKADDIKEIKPIGYIDKNCFFDMPTNSNSPSVPIWAYLLSNPRDLTNQSKPLKYKLDMTGRRNAYSNLDTFKLDPKDPKVHFYDKNLTGIQTVGLVSGGNDITGQAYEKRWSDVKANSYPHKYGATIKYDIHVNIPYLLFTNKLTSVSWLKYSHVKESKTVSLSREVQR